MYKINKNVQTRAVTLHRLALNARDKGFTLIELLVVIAIIGVLAAVVLAALNEARDKGSDASTVSSLNNSRAQAELHFHDSVNGYTGLCLEATADGIYPMLEGALEVSQAASIHTGSNVGTRSTVVCRSTATDWAASAPIYTNDGYYCVDSTGFGGVRTNPLAGGAYECPAS